MHRRTRVAVLALIAVLTSAAPAGAITHGVRVNGESGSPEAVPYIAALVDAGEPAYDTQFCGATVIAPDVVLTAAHCVKGTAASRITVVTGRTTLSDEDSGQRTGVASIWIHPFYSSYSGHHDTAVVILKRAVDVPPLPLARPGTDDAGVLTPGREVTVAGWGRTSNAKDDEGSDALRMAALTVRSDRRCSRAYDGDFAPSLMLCASRGAADSCSGDSGGPLVGRAADGMLRQVGIVSFGGGRCGDPTQPGVYTEVRADTEWIARTSGVELQPVQPIRASTQSPRSYRA